MVQPAAARLRIALRAVQAQAAHVLMDRWWDELDLHLLEMRCGLIELFFFGNNSLQWLEQSDSSVREVLLQCKV